MSFFYPATEKNEKMSFYPVAEKMKKWKKKKEKMSFFHPAAELLRIFRDVLGIGHDAPDVLHDEFHLKN
jgi:hypothetical protein